jgi:hypothetical protein
MSDGKQEEIRITGKKFSYEKMVHIYIGFSLGDGLYIGKIYW